MMASVMLDGKPPDPQFGLSRFATPPAGGWQEKWS